MSQSISTTLRDLRVAYSKFDQSGGETNRYTIESQTARFRELQGAANKLLDAKTMKRINGIYERDLGQAYKTGTSASRDLSKVIDGVSTSASAKISKMPIAAQAAAGQRLNAYWDKEKATLRTKVTEATLGALQRGKGWKAASKDIAEALKTSGQVKKSILTSRDALTSVTAKNNIAMNLESRADLIARTEIAAAYVQGQMAQYRNNGYTHGRWSATGERSCPFCVSREGAIYELAEIENAIPAHPRCRCTIAPVMGEVVNKVMAAKDQSAAAAQLLNDAEWTKIRNDRFNEFKQFAGKPLSDPSKYLRTPTNTERFFKGPDAKAAQPIWVPSGSAIPDLEGAQAAAIRAKDLETALRAEEIEKQTLVKERKGEEFTFKRFSDATGDEPGPDTKWTAERQKLHDEIVQNFLKNGKKSATPTFTMSGGGPASGKGFMLKKTGLDKPGKVVIDADEIKKLIPEYAKAQKTGGSAQQAAAGVVHEESSYLAKRIMAEASKRGFDIVLDGTGDSGIKSLTKKVQKMRDAGYRVEAKYVSADTEVAAQRNWDRFLKTGRLPPEWMLRNVHADVSRTLPQALDKGLFDAVELYDTNKTGELRKVISQKDGKTPTIRNKKLWDDFKRKGDAEQVTKEQGERLIEARKLKVDEMAVSSHAKHSNARAKGAEPGPDTVWTLERQKLHQEIVDKFLANGISSSNPTFTMSGGGPASGKGFMLKATGLDKPGKVVIDADEIKKLIPEYADAQKKGGKAQQQAAGYVHEESSYLSKRIMAEAAKRSYDVVLDGTGDSGINSLTKKVQKMRDQGYRVEAKYVSADTELAAQRNWDRFLKTGRLPPEWMLRNVHADVSRTLPEAMKKGLFDAVELFDTNLSGQLRKVVSQKGKQKPTIHDKQLWEDFKNKGKAKQVTPEEGELMIARRKAESAAAAKALKKAASKPAQSDQKQSGFESLLAKQSITSLKSKAKQAGLVGYSKLKKDELVKVLAKAKPAAKSPVTKPKPKPAPKAKSKSKVDSDYQLVKEQLKMSKELWDKKGPEGKAFALKLAKKKAEKNKGKSKKQIADELKAAQKAAEEAKQKFLAAKDKSIQDKAKLNAETNKGKFGQIDIDKTNEKIVKITKEITDISRKAFDGTLTIADQDRVKVLRAERTALEQQVADKMAKNVKDRPVKKLPKTTDDIDFQPDISEYRSYGFKSENKFDKALSDVEKWSGNDYKMIRNQQLMKADQKLLTAYEKSKVARYKESLDFNSKKYQSMADDIETYVKNAPKYKGEVLRGQMVDSVADAEALLKQMQKGRPSQALESWTNDSQVAREFAVGGEAAARRWKAGNVALVFRMDNRSGVPIAGVSTLGSESEVLMPSGMKTQVKKISKKTVRGKLIWTIDLVNQ